MLSPAKIAIELTSHEALVLFEWLAKLGESEAKAVLVEQDEAAQQVLWAIEAQLEKQLVEPLDANYDTFLKEARDRVRGIS